MCTFTEIEMWTLLKKLNIYPNNNESVKSFNLGEF
jgi:hypothetical protein